MSPEEICQKLGEPKTKSIFLELTADAMKKVVREAKLPTTRLASHTSTRKRNEDWAARVWRSVAERSSITVAATLLYEWLTRARRPMLNQFLTALEVPNDNGLTDADFMKDSAPERLLEAGKALLSGHDRAEVAAYLLFLDASNKSAIFAPLELAEKLAPAPSPQKE